jgi:hypothetical protein
MAYRSFGIAFALAPLFSAQVDAQTPAGAVPSPAIPKHIRNQCAGKPGPAAECLRTHMVNYHQVFDFMRQRVNQPMPNNSPGTPPADAPRILIQNCLSHFGPFGPVFTQHCNRIPIYIDYGIYSTVQAPLRTYDGPDFIFDFCVANFRVYASINRCLSRESQLFHSTEGYLRQEIANEDTRNSIFQTCIDRNGNQGMSWVEHCARAEANYRRMFP